MAYHIPSTTPVPCPRCNSNTSDIICRCGIQCTYGYPFIEFDDACGLELMGGSHFVDSLPLGEYEVFFDKENYTTRVRDSTTFIIILVIPRLMYDITESYIDKMLLLK